MPRITSLRTLLEPTAAAGTPPPAPSPQRTTQHRTNPAPHRREALRTWLRLSAVSNVT